MSADSPRESNTRGSAPRPISALPLPKDDAPEKNGARAPQLPTNSSGELTPAQRARLGLDVYGDRSRAAPEAQDDRDAAAPTSGLPAIPTPPAPAARSAQPTQFGFTEIDPYGAPAEQGSAGPRLEPAATIPSVAAVPPGGAQVRQRTAADDREDPDANAGLRSGTRKQSIDERDGIPQINRDRKVLTYGISWTFFCLFATAAISYANIFAGSGQGASPATFVPAMVSIVIGWVIVFVARNMGPNWGWLMLIPAVVLVIGPFFYTSWRLDQTVSDARAYLSSQAATAEVDIDASTIVSETVNTPQGCFAFTKLLSNSDVMIDVVTYAPATAQQQATMALSPRFARRVQPGGPRASQRTFSMDGGSLPVVVEERLTPPIDCANTSAP